MLHSFIGEANISLRYIIGHDLFWVKIMAIKLELA